MTRRVRLVRVPEPDPERMAAEYAAGAASREMEARYRLSWRRIKAMIEPYVERRGRGPRRQADHDLVPKLRERGLSHSQIVAETGLSRTGVRRIARGRRWTATGAGTRPAIPDAAIVEAARRGWTQTQTAAEHGVHPGTVRRRWRQLLHRHGISGAWSPATARALTRRMGR